MKRLRFSLLVLATCLSGCHTQSHTAATSTPPTYSTQSPLVLGFGPIRLPEPQAPYQLSTPLVIDRSPPPLVTVTDHSGLPDEFQRARYRPEYLIDTRVTP